MSDCIDVRTLGRFKTRMSADHVPGRHKDPWNIELLCRNGVIYPHGGEYLQAYSTKRNTRVMLRSLANAYGDIHIHKDGDFETTVRFHVSIFDVIAKALLPRRKRNPETALNLRRGPIDEAKGSL